MTTTVGQLATRISEVRSKIAVLEGLVLYLKTNYFSSEDGVIPAEMHFTRADGAAVPESHVLATQADIVEQITTFRLELEEWEATVIPSVEKPAPSNGHVKPGKKPGKKEKSDGPRSRSEAVTPPTRGES